MRHRFALVFVCLTLGSSVSAQQETSTEPLFRPAFLSRATVSANRTSARAPQGWWTRGRSARFGSQFKLVANENLVELAPPGRENLPAPPTPSFSDAHRLKEPDELSADESPSDWSLSKPPIVEGSEGPAIRLDDLLREDAESDDKDDKKHPFAETRSSFAWIAGGPGNDVGFLEYDSEPLSRVRYDAFANPGQNFNFLLSTSFGARWLQGPDMPDLPPYLFNILINTGATIQFSDRFAVDAIISPGWYTDFSNKGVKAFRLPWHVVTFHKLAANSDWQLVLGVTDLSRDDIRWLPVVGTIYAPKDGDVRLDLVFPKPKVAWRAYTCEGYSTTFLNSERHEGWLYVAGELGGGSWAISRQDRAYDVMTYRDYRLNLGLETRRKKGQTSRLEVGYVFGRAVEYASQIGNYDPPNTLMVRIATDY